MCPSLPYIFFYVVEVLRGFFFAHSERNFQVAEGNKE